MKIILNEKLRELRRKKDITQEELANRQKYDPKNTSKNYAHNDSHSVLQGLKNKLYDFIRHDARFEAIIEKLEAVAK